MLNNSDVLRNVLLKSGYQMYDPKTTKYNKSSHINVKTNLSKMVKNIDTNEDLKTFRTNQPI